jgi:lambda family phage minor tail protein L
MTINSDLQKQQPGSELVTLFELEKPNGQFAYLTRGLDDDLSTLQMYDYDSPSTLRTYVALPITSDGFDIKVTGAISRPTLNVTLISTAFATQMGTTDFDSLVGKKVIRRLTLKRYLKGESSDPGSGNTPIEFTRQVWTISKITSRDAAFISFELVAPYDLQGVKIPAREIISNACPWQYTGASPDLAEHAKCGGCSWHRESKFTPHNYINGQAMTGVEFTVYINIDNESIIPASTSFTNYTTASSSTNFAVEAFIKTTATATKVNSNGTLSSANINEYWQVATAGAKSALGTPSDSNTKFERVRVHQGAYSASTAYSAFTDDRLNDIVTYTSGGKTYIWKTTVSHTGNTPGFNNFWKRADECGKTLTSCGKRFGFTPIDITSASSLGKTEINSTVTLPFGAFPGSKSFK